MMGKIFLEVNSYRLDLLFSNIRSCASFLSCTISMYLIGILKIILKNAWQLLFVAPEGKFKGL